MGDLLRRARSGWYATVSLLTVAAATITAAAPLPNYRAKADVDPPAGTPATVTADPLPTWQVNGVVWSMATVGNTVYAVGSFTRARPPGVAAGGAGEVTRNNILAFDLTTGNLITSFNHSLNGTGLRVVASPDGSRIYVGGQFTTVDGVTRNRIAAFNTATGALDTSFAPSVGSTVRGIAVSNSTVYFGGNFFSVNGSARTRLAAAARSNGALQAWAPTADDDEVFAMTMTPDQSRVIVGGRFQTLNGAARVGVGALDPTSGASLTWNSNPIPARSGSNYSYVTDLVANGSTIYATADGEGGHWFDGRFAASAANGDLVWLDNCYGASYGGHVAGQVFYTVSHAHDCSSVGTFPEANPRRWQRATAETIYPTGNDFAAPGANSSYNRQPIPTMLHWYPALGVGSYTGQYQAAWAATGNNQYLALGGEFPSANGRAQQGLVRYALKGTAPGTTGPLSSAGLQPAVTSQAGGTARVSWQTTWDYDNANLTYEVLRDGGTTPVGTVKAGSGFWSLPRIGFVDRGLTPGSSHTYRIRVRDSLNNTVTGATSAAVTIASGTAPGPYTQEVAGDGAISLWRLGEPSGTTAQDFLAGTDATMGAGVTRGTAGALSGDTDTATTFNGTSAGTAGSPTVSNPRDFSVEAWFKTATTTGGKIMGYGNSQTGTSNTYDRHIYMDNSGRIFYGAYPGSSRTINSSGTYRDNQWHHVVATQDYTGGAKLYIDGTLVAQDATLKQGQFYTGYWRIGGDNLNGWPSRPTSNWFNGAIDEAAVYQKALTASQIADHYAVGKGTATPNVQPTAAYTHSCTQLACSFDGSSSTDSDGSVTGYAWDFGDGTTGTGATPSHTFATAGTYNVKLTVTDDDDATGTVTKAISVTSPTLASDTFSRTVSGGLGTANTGGAWTISGTASNFSVDGSNAAVVFPAAAAARSGYLNSVSSASTDLTLRLAVDKVTTGAGLYFSAAARNVSGAGSYRARVRLLPTGAVVLSLIRTNASGTETYLVTEQTIAGLTYGAGTVLRMRVQAAGTAPTTVRAKVWADGSAEPAAWQESATDTTAELQAAGSVGFYGYLSGSATNAPITLALDDVTAVTP